MKKMPAIILILTVFSLSIFPEEIIDKDIEDSASLYSEQIQTKSTILNTLLAVPSCISGAIPTGIALFTFWGLSLTLGGEGDSDISQFKNAMFISIVIDWIIKGSSLLVSTVWNTTFNNNERKNIKSMNLSLTEKEDMICTLKYDQLKGINKGMILAAMSLVAAIPGYLLYFSVFR